MHGGGDELHRHRVSGLMRVGGFWIRTNELLRDGLGFRLRFGSPILGVHVTTLESVGPHYMANLIGAHIFNKKKKLQPIAPLSHAPHVKRSLGSANLFWQSHQY